MLTQIIVDNLQGHTIGLPLQNPVIGYLVKDIKGLDPVKATLTSSPFAGLDGSVFQSSRREPRNIILTIGVDESYSNHTIQERRQNLYKYFMPKSVVDISFFLDDVNVAHIQGVVESFDMPFFAKDPEIVVSIMCYDPAFVQSGYHNDIGSTVSTSTEKTVTYDGSIATGIEITITANRTVSDEIAIYMRRPSNEITALRFTVPMVSGDTIKMISVPKQKALILKHSTFEFPVLYALTTDSQWPVLYPGDNYLRIYNAGASLAWTSKWTELYGGL